MVPESSSSEYLKQALALAELRRGFCAPNPAVGAVVVKNGEVIATGVHWAAGSPHAEVVALDTLTMEQSRDATIFVTLEPCSHYGRTPPCAKLLIERRIKTVYYGFKDPNPLVAGNGERQLLAAGIACHHLPLAEIDAFYASYAYWTQYKLPVVTAKLAISLNGKIAGSDGEPLPITGKALQQYTHQWRKRSDAILTTGKTILQDDPQLNVRLDQTQYQKPVYILDSKLLLPSTARINTTAAKITIFYSENVALQQHRQLLEARGICCVPVAQNHGIIDLNQILTRIGQDGVHDLWVEAGGTCFHAFLSQKLAQRLLLYVAPKWLPENNQSAFNNANFDLSQLGKLQWHIIGEDVVCEVKVNTRR